MAKKMSISAQKRQERTAKIVRLGETYATSFATKLDLYLFIAEKVGCSHITVWRTLKEAEQCK